MDVYGDGRSGRVRGAAVAAVAGRIKNKTVSRVENMGIGQEVRVRRNDKCAGQSIRSCQADGKLESWLDTETN